MKNDGLTIVTADSSDVSVESKFSTLNSLKFIRGKTELDQWYILINDSWSKTNIPRDDIISAYLVTMLHKFSRRVELFEQLKAFSYAEYLFGNRKIDDCCLEDIADICLQFVSYFSESTENRYQMKSLQYVSELGTTFYTKLAKDSSSKEDWYSLAYQKMRDSFGIAVMVLRSTNMYKTPLVDNGLSDHVLIMRDYESYQVKKTINQMSQMYTETSYHTENKVQ